MRKSWVWILAAACSGVGCSAGDPVVLTVGEKTVTLSQLEETFWEAAARDSTIGPDLAGVQKVVEQRAEDLLMQILAEETEPDLDFQRQERLDGYREQLTVEHLRDVEFGDAYEVTPKDLEEAYAKLATRRKVRGLTLATESEAREVQRTLREGAAFAKVAERRSIDERSRASGGDYGWLTYTDVPPNDRDEVFSLDPGERSRILQRGDQFQIYLVEEVEPNHAQRSLEEERTALEQGIILRRLTQARSDYEERLFERYHFQLKPVEIAWLTAHMRAKTAGAVRGEAAMAETEEIDGVLWNRGKIPWEGLPVAVADTGRVVATFDPPNGRVTPLLVFDQLGTKSIPTWPVFDKTSEVEELIRDLVMEQLEVREATSRGYLDLPEIDYQVQLRQEEIRRRQYLRNQFRDPLRPEPAELRAEYERRLAEFTRPEARSFLAINVVSRTAAERAADLLRANVPLAEIRDSCAPSDSFQSTPPNGTGPMIRGRSPLLDDVLFQLALGEVSTPVPVGGRFTVAQVLSIEPEKISAFEDVAARIISGMVDARQEEALAKVLAEARLRHPVVIDQAALTKVRTERDR